jgi:hypothetical protein
MEQLTGYREIMARIKTLHDQGLKDPAIADALNAEGWHPPKRRDTFTAFIVRDLLHRQGVTSQARNSPCLAVERQTSAELTIQELARRLDMPWQTVYGWLRRGVMPARQAMAEARPIWLIATDEAEIQRLLNLRSNACPRKPKPAPEPQTEV